MPENTGIALDEFEREFEEIAQEVEILIKAVLIFDEEGNYFIHGTSDETPDTMFKAMHPLWSIDPSKETVHYVEIPMMVVKPSANAKPYVKR